MKRGWERPDVTANRETVRAVAEGIGRGESFGIIGRRLGVSRQRVGQIARRHGFGSAHKPLYRRPESQHGTEYRYGTLGCRCEPCRAAHSGAYYRGLRA